MQYAIRLRHPGVGISAVIARRYENTTVAVFEVKRKSSF
jgi:hypothetical protein